MRNLKISFAFSFCVLIISTQAIVSNFLTSNDKTKLLETLENSSESDVSVLYFKTKVYEILGEKLDKKDRCSTIKKLLGSSVSSENEYYGLVAWKLLKCDGNLFGEVTLKKLRETYESDKSSIVDIRYAVEALSFLGENPKNPTKIYQLVEGKLKENDNLINMAHFMHLSHLLGLQEKFLSGYGEDILVQADEVDGKLLQWEGGLTTSSLLITGLLRVKKDGNLNQEQADKLASYLLTRKTVQSPKGVFSLLVAMKSLINSPVSPLSISIIGSSSIKSDNANLKLRVCDLLGNPFKPNVKSVVAQSATRITDDVVVMSKQPFTPNGDSSEFSLPLKLTQGHYRILLSANNQMSTIIVHISSPVKIGPLEIGVGDSDSLITFKKININEQLTIPLQGEAGQHLIVKFSLDRKIHQTFMRFSFAKKNIIFVAECESGNNYKLDINLSSELTYSGLYQMELILADSTMSNPIQKVIGSINVKLNVPEKKIENIRKPKPTIEHLFRPSEKRPLKSLSLFFTGLTLAPLLILFILWIRIKINFKFMYIAIPFHLGFGGILGLFTVFWLKLDMFTTCTWLIPIGGFTFFTGHKLLSYMVDQKKRN